MPISQARMAEWRCARCGEVTSRLTWLAVDALERPDLMAQVSGLVECECSSCGRPTRRSQPLLVLRLARVAPVIAARASDDRLDPLESLGEVVAVVQRELGDALREVPGPVVVVTFDEIEAGAQADIDADVGTVRAGASRAVDHDSAYAGLLGKIGAIQNLRQIEIGLTEVALVGDEMQLRAVVERYPEIVSDEAERYVAARLERETTEGAQRFGRSMLRTLQLSREGDFRGAWSVRESVIRSYQNEVIVPRFEALEAAKRGGTRQSLAQAGRDLLAVLPPGVDLKLQVEVAATTMVALLGDEGAGRDESVETAISLGHFALSTMEENPDLDNRQHRLVIATNLSVAYGRRSAWRS